MKKIFTNFIYYSIFFFKFFYKWIKWIFIFLALPIFVVHLFYKKRVEKEVNY